jgi:hypothetical protein
MNSPKRATPVRLSRNLSTGAVSPGPPEKGSKKISRIKAVTSTLQMRAIQCRIFAECGKVFVTVMEYSYWRYEKIFSSYKRYASPVEYILVYTIVFPIRNYLERFLMFLLKVRDDLISGIYF